MAVTDGYGSPPAERVVARLHQHAYRMLGPSLALIVICGVAGYYGSVFGGWVGVVIWIAALLLAIFAFLLPLSSWLSTRYTVTTRRLVMRTGLLTRERRELLHSRGYTVTVRASWLQSAFRSGSIRIGGMDQKTVVQLRAVPRVRAVTEALHDLMENSERAYSAGWAPGSEPGAQP
ncbi:PH domain-containing protein [Planctomonas sp. JC2975]|uniref:PH domain-containing protein n=1 Tax=Planctomonas sp. JC2975 TaxID=2729626 RepID=UPI0014751CE4|nr:PH domain-containing protein [Planctomonas sp. JC2975]NNC13050.1 PH domain-containing protein [Planctomonas sp. JC2975]